MKLHATVAAVTARIRERSRASRSAYLQRVAEAGQRRPGAERLGCANVAHAFAALPANDKLRVVAERAPNIGIVTAFNDMLSAHAPLQHYPDLIKAEARRLGATAQVAGGVPAMCDGVTQGTPGMELSLFSRDVIAMATAGAITEASWPGCKDFPGWRPAPPTLRQMDPRNPACRRVRGPAGTGDDLVDQLLALRPESRPSPTQALASPFFFNARASTQVRRPIRAKVPESALDTPWMDKLRRRAAALNSAPTVPGAQAAACHDGPGAP